MEQNEALLAELAWGLIANAYGGDWGLAPTVWREAAERWRDEYHNQLDCTTEEDNDDKLANQAT